MTDSTTATVEFHTPTASDYTIHHRTGPFYGTTVGSLCNVGDAVARLIASGYARTGGRHSLTFLKIGDEQ